MSVQKSGVATAVVALTALAACSQRSPTNAHATLRLSPEAALASGIDAARLVDRDTTAAVSIAQRTTVTLRFPHEVEVRRVKVHGARSLGVEVAGLSLGAPDAAGWSSGDLASPITTRELTLTVVPLALGAQLDEVEAWGAGKDLAPRDVASLAKATAATDAPYFENAWTLRADPASATLEPVGTGEGSPCVRARFPAADPRQARRAYLAYEANVLRGGVLQHSFDGDPPVDGMWLGSASTVRTTVAEVDPERLRGSDEVLLCLPDDAGGAVQVTGLRLLLVLDDGTVPADRDAWLRARNAVDGDPSTSTAAFADPVAIGFDRAIDVESAELLLGHVPARLGQIGTHDAGTWTDRAGADVTATPAALPVSGRADAVRLTFASSSARSDVPAAAVAELSVTGSGVGPRVGAARIVLTSPAISVSGGHDVGERFGDEALVSGWAESPSGRGAVELDGARVDVDGAFSQVVRRPAGATGSWPVSLRARFPDGTEVARTVYLDDDRSGEELGDTGPDGSTTADQRFGREDQTAWGAFDPALGGRVALGTDVSIEAPPGAVGARTSIGITRKGPEVMPRLDAGMINVTAPAHSAYRFLPKGQKFAKPVTLKLPYDPDLLPDGVAPEEIQTYFFDEDQGRWFTLPRRQVLRASRQVVSETTHFTFMINAVMVLPDHPGPVSFNPTSIKDLKAADPSAGIDFIEPPQGNDEGSARLSYPIRLPRGRGAYQPSLAIAYESTAGDGWLGVGWNLAVPHVSIDTRYGVPEYGGEERYLLDGEAIVPVGSSSGGPTCLDATVPAREYRARVERDFRRILRCGEDPSRYWFEVTDKGGTVHVYGHGENARLTSYVPRVSIPPVSPPRYDIAEWYLERVVDPNGNLTEYAYQHDSPGVNDGGEPFRQIYLRSIQYTGTAPRTSSSALEGGTPGAYLIELHHDPADRPDEITSARSGFKTVTRRLLKEIEVRLLAGSPSGLVRRYVLSYVPGDMGKSLLRKVVVQGADGKEFYSHAFEYWRRAPDDGDVTLFGPPIPWVTDDGSALGESADWSFGLHGFVGIGVTASKSNATVGVGFGYGRQQSSTVASMIDLNGDGLPDRVFDAGVDQQVHFNQGSGEALSTVPPPWDPAASSPSVVSGLADHSLGSSTGNTFDASVQAFYGSGKFGGSVNFGANYSLSSSNDIVADANGDGLPDLVNGGKVLFNQPRSASCADGSTTCCAAGGFCFSPSSVPVQSLEDLGDSASLITGDPTLAQANEAMNDALTPEDAVLEWTAPYAGAVDVTGELAFAAATTAGDRRDGVRLRVYRYDPHTKATDLEGTWLKTPGDATATPVQVPNVKVDPGTILYFVVSTLSDFPMHGADGSLSPVERVSFSPVITYLGTRAADRTLKGPSGARLYQFDATSDFVLAGDPPGAVGVPLDGQLAFSLALSKPATSDDVRVCVQYQDPPKSGETPPDRPGACADEGSSGFVDRSTYTEFTAKLDAATTPTGMTIDVPQLAVKAGGKLYVRMDTDVSIDPRGVKLVASGSYACVQGSGGACDAPSADEQRRVSFRVVPYLPLHDDVVDPDATAWKPSGQPVIPVRVTKAGTIHVDSIAQNADRSVPIYFTVRTLDQLVLKAKGNHGSVDDSGTYPVSKSARVAPGDLIFFEAHSESASSFAPILTPDGSGGPPFWSVTCTFVADDGTTSDCNGLDPLPVALTTERRLDAFDDGNQPVLAGGYHGWRYGAWHGRNEDDFTPWVYRGPTRAEMQGWSGNGDDVVDAQSENMQKADDPQRLRLKLAGLLVPNDQGTRLQQAIGADAPVFQEAGDTFVSQDGNTYFTTGIPDQEPKALRMNAGIAGESAASQAKAPDGTVAKPVTFAIRKIGRSSASVGVSLNLGVQAEMFKVGVSAGVSLGEGLSQQKMDVLDMNGDGFLDVVVASGMPSPMASATEIAGTEARGDVRVTSPVTLATRRTVRMKTFPQISRDVSGSVNLGTSPPMRALTPDGNTSAMVSRFPGVGGGLAFSVGSVLQQLVDVNGDGLPDAVSVGTGTCSGIVVHLNMGTSFAANGDCIALDPTEFPRDSILGNIGLAGDPALRRSTTVTLQGTAGADLLRSIGNLEGGIDHSESWGVAIGVETSLTATNVALVDVTGDGLPDYVYKGNRGDDFSVRVNTGYGFAPARTWRATAPWCGGTGPCAHIPRIHLGKVATNVLDAFLGDGNATGIEPLEATGSHSIEPSVSFSVDFSFLLSPIGTPWLHVGGGASVSPRKVGGFELGLQDIDGDGLPDQVLKTSDDAPVWARLNQLGKSNLLKRVVRPLGGSVDLAYEKRVGNTVDMPQSRWVLTDVTAHDGRATPGELGHDLSTRYDYDGGRYDRLEREFLGFSKVTRTNPDGTKVVQVFDNASVFTKELLVSERVIGGDDRVWAETSNEWIGPQPGAFGEPAQGCADETPVSLDPASYCGSFFTKLHAVEKRFYEGQPRPGIVTRQEFGYDDSGNVVSFHDFGDVADPADDVVAAVQYAADAAASTLYSVARPKSVVVTDLSGKVLRSRSAEYDASGNLKTLVADIGNGRSATTDLHWNGNGTLDWVLGPENETHQRYQTSYGYDETTGTYVTRITDSHGYASSAEYDLRFGEATITKDVNGKVTARRFDDDGRLERIAGPKDTIDAPTVWMTYTPAAFPAYAWTHNRMPRKLGDTTGRVDTVVAMDGLGRTIQTKKTAEMATSLETKGLGWSVSGQQRYDAMGRVALQGQTFASFSARPEFVPGTPRNPTRFVYDELGRVIQTLEPDGSITRVDHGFGAPAGSVTQRFRTVTTDAEGHAKATYADAADRVVAVEERIEGRTPTTSYEYDPVGELRKVVDAAGNTTRAEYDLLGRRTKLVNPDTGELRFELDAAGDVIRKYDPNLDRSGRFIHYVYDYDQLVRIEYPDSTRNVTYVHGSTSTDAEANGVGRVVEVHDDAGVEKRTYDELGSLASSTRILKAMPPYYREQTFKTSFTWDSFGRMMTITYPDLETVAYQYDGGGLLDKAAGTRPAGSSAPGDEVYLSSIVYDEFGQRVRMVLGNGVVSTYGYEPLTRRLHTLGTVTPLRRTLQAITYGYDRVGNVKTMVNALGAPVGDRSGEVRYAFQYDDLYRLTIAHGEAESRAHTIDRFTATYAFSDIHDMTSNVQVHEILHAGATVSAEPPPQTNHDFAYAYDPAHPHQATKIGDTFLVYDANGNTTAECRDQGDPTCSATADHLRRFYWTDENRLDHVVDGGGRNITRFVYDAAGERVVKLGRGGESITVGQFWSLKGRRAATKHVFAGATRLASKLLPPPGWTGAPTATTTDATVTAAGTTDAPPGCDPSNYQPQKCPVLPGGEPSVNHRFDDTTVRPETYYYHPDHLGSTSWVTDQNGRVHEHVEYFPYGEVWRDPQSDADGAPVKGQRFLFTSKEFDEETGLYLIGARYLDPARARWLSPDPAMPSRLANPWSLSPFAYSRNNPINLIDPTGLSEKRAEPVEMLPSHSSAGMGGAPVFSSKPEPTEPTIQCHGVSARGYSGNTEDFKGLTAIPGSGVEARQGYRVISVTTQLFFDLLAPLAAEAVAPLLAAPVESGSSIAAGVGGTQEASSAASAARLRAYLRQAEKYGGSGIRELQNGRIRFYGEVSPAETPGEMAGRRLVREWSPETGATRTWHETLDRLGNVRQVRPETGGPKVHYVFDANGQYVGVR